MIDEETKSVPDFDVMLNKTTRRKLTTEENILCNTSAVPLLKIMLKKGRITEEDFDNYGFKPDRY